MSVLKSVCSLLLFDIQYFIQTWGHLRPAAGVIQRVVARAEDSSFFFFQQVTRIQRTRIYQRVKNLFDLRRKTIGFGGADWFRSPHKLECLYSFWRGWMVVVFLHVKNHWGKEMISFDDDLLLSIITPRFEFLYLQASPNLILSCFLHIHRWCRPLSLRQQPQWSHPSSSSRFFQTRPYNRIFGYPSKSTKSES